MILHTELASKSRRARTIIAVGASVSALVFLLAVAGLLVWSRRKRLTRTAGNITSSTLSANCCSSHFVRRRKYVNRKDSKYISSCRPDFLHDNHRIEQMESQFTQHWPSLRGKQSRRWPGAADIWSGHNCSCYWRFLDQQQTWWGWIWTSVQGTTLYIPAILFLKRSL